ncbi:MAG TPA: hypothetical protein VJ505_09810 [Holophagaceae bacterium]|nr:hypothetical protein [Holophagaceae bacterium]
MGLLNSLFGRRDQANLPPLENLLSARGCPADLPGLKALRPEYEHLHSLLERENWASAVDELYRRGLELPPVYEDIQDHLLPELVPTWQAEREGRWKRLFVEGLHQRLVLEGQAIPAPWLALWARPEADILERAMDALRARTEAKPFLRLTSGIYKSPWNDGLDAARLLLPEVWHPIFPDQNPFYAIPNASSLFVAPQILLPKLVEATGEALKGGVLLQAGLLQRVGDKLVPARLQEPHPMASPQKELKQLDLLEALRVQALDIDPALGLPAPVGMIRGAQGKPMTLATWQEGDQPVLIPEVDLIAFITRDSKPLGLYNRTTLPRLTEMKGEPLPVWGPRRLRYSGFPTAEQLARLDQAATPEQMRGLLEGPASPSTAQAQAPATPRPAPQGRPAGKVDGTLSTQPVPALPAHLRDQLGKRNE